jgi:AraC family transcriptional activator of tynA and feaB
MKSVFTTSTVAVTQRVELWQNFVSGAFAPVEISDFDLVQFEAHIDAVQLGDLGLSHFTGTGHGICRPRRMIRSSDADMFVAVVQLSGALSYAQNTGDGRHLTNNVTLFDMTRDYRSMFHDRMDFIDVTIPRKRIETLLGSTRHLAGLTLGPEQPMTAMIVDFFRRQVTMANQLSPETAGRVGAIGMDLLAAGFLEHMGQTPGQTIGNAAAMARAKAFVRANLGDCTLSPEIVAASENLSLRRMQELFAAEMLTISDYIWEQRLLRGKYMLEGRAFDRLSIAEIGGSVGFVSIPHFSRRFRLRFGCTPVECRQRHIAEPAFALQRQSNLG